MQINQYISNSAYMHNLSSQKPQNFTSRNAMVRELDDIVRITRREFQMSSHTYLEHHFNLRNDACKKMHKFNEGLIGEVRGFSSIDSKPSMRIIKSLETAKELKVGNCNEYARATYLACKLNGYDDVKFLSLFAYNPKTKKIRELDHAVVGVNFKKPTSVDVAGVPTDVYMRTNDGIVLDAWKGYTGFEREATTSFKNDRIFGKLKDGEVMCYRESGQMIGLNRDDLLYLKHKNPNLIKRPKFSLKDALRWLVMDKKQYEYEPMAKYIIETYRFNSGLKGAMTRDELTQFLTNKAYVSQRNAIIKMQEDMHEKHCPTAIIKNVLKQIGRKIFE